MPSWTLEEMRNEFGDEYPDAVMVKGVRVPLARERRFMRFFESDDQEMGSFISRFLDGSASITAEDLQREWADWSKSDQSDFCYASSWLSGQADFPEMLRFILQHGGPEHWSGIALSVAYQFPREEAFSALKDALANVKSARSCNLTQAIATTKHPEAETVLREHLASLWADPKLWDDDEFTNWIAFDTITCIEHLVELGASPSNFEAQVRRLSQHVCSGNRYSCWDFLHKHYSWLKK